MIRRFWICTLCIIAICSFMSIAVASGETTETELILPPDHIQYYVKWDPAREPVDASITEQEYLDTVEKDLNNNGILDSLDKEVDVEGEVNAASIATGILGDLNGDELVDNRDVVLMYRHIAGWDQDINSDILDFNGDGYVTNSDATHLLNYVSGWPNTILYKGKKYDIIYHLYSESMYQDAEINNTNPDYYYGSEGLSLKNITADGYIFEGWYDGEGSSATRIRKIEAGETGEIELYARWTPRTYKIDFDSSLVAVESKYYTIETGATLTNPAMSNYVFVGWTNQDDGRLVKGIPKGSFGNKILVANWASRRNLARPVRSLEDPIIAEDSTNGKILFLYRIGDIENIPLFTLYRFSTAEGIVTSTSVTEQTSISTSDAKTIGEIVAKATTDSASWTLSEGWNENTTVSSESLQQTGRTREEAETIAKSTSNTFRLDSSVGESEVIVDSSQYAYKGSGTVGNTTGTTTESGQNVQLSVDYKTEMEAGLDIEVLTAKRSQSLELGAEYGNHVNHTNTSTDSWSNTFETAKTRSNTATASKEWNSSASFSNSNSMSSSRTTSQQISEMISSKYGYGQSYSKNGAQSSGQEFTTQNTQQSNYSNTVTYNSSELCEKTTTFTTDGKLDGYYRQVLAGTAHVFGIVGYDVATRSYFTYTFTVMDDATYPFLDYSKTTPNFNDNEIGVLPFEIPVFVNNYVNSRVAKTTGLQINIGTGKVTGYSGEDSVIVIPSYVDINNGDGTYTSVKITGLDNGAFRNNTTIEGVMFSEFITEIPDSAFEGCTSLKDVFIPNLRKIGNRAFYGCSALSTLTIPEDVTSIGSQAFYNVKGVNIIAHDKDAALAAVNSGVKSLVLNISSINDEMANEAIVVPSSMNVFEIQGGRKQYENLRIKSQADKTTINGINFVNCTQVPLEMHSSTITLNQSNASGTGYCMIIASDNCRINLFGESQMNSSGGNAIVCGNVTLANSDSGVQSRLQVSGNVYVCGSITNQNQYLSLTNGSIINITKEQYSQYVSGVYQLKFDANGGSIDEESRTAYSGTSIGALPTPNRTGYTFAGWYTAPSGGTQVTASSTFVSSSSVTIYALWTANTYTVNFDVNGGDSVSLNSKTVAYNGTYGTLAEATWDYHKFDGWYTAASGGTKIVDTDIVTITSSQTLYAHWTLKTFDVVFDPVNGTCAVSNMTATSGVELGTLPVPEWADGVFQGWYPSETVTAADGSSISTETKIINTTALDSDTTVTLKAKWLTYGAWSAWTTTYVASTSTRQVQSEVRNDPNYITRYNYNHYKYWNSTYNNWFFSYGSGMGGGSWEYYHQDGSPLPVLKYVDGQAEYKAGDGSLWFNQSTEQVQSGTKAVTYYRYRDAH